MLQLICPDIQLPKTSVRRKFREIENHLTRLSDEIAKVAALEALVGLEVRTALQLVRAGNPDTKTRAILFRPAVEPILLLHGERVCSDLFNPIDALAMACSLTGRELTVRSERCFGRSALGQVEFEAPERTRLWFPEIKAIIGNEAMGIAASAAIFARTITSHPYSDGNGRFARALTHAVLLRKRSRPIAPIALAPAVYGKRDELSHALVDLCRTGVWDRYYETFIGTLEAAIAIAQPFREELLARNTAQRS